MRFGHMRCTAHFLCNADKKGEEEGGEFNGEETCVTRAKKRSDAVSCNQQSDQSDLKRAEQQTWRSP